MNTALFLMLAEFFGYRGVIVRECGCTKIDCPRHSHTYYK